MYSIASEAVVSPRSIASLNTNSIAPATRYALAAAGLEFAAMRINQILPRAFGSRNRDIPNMVFSCTRGELPKSERP